MSLSKNLKQFLRDNQHTDLDQEHLVHLFFEQYGLPDITTQADLDREVFEINQLINEVNLQSIYRTLGI